MKFKEWWAVKAVPMLGDNPPPALTDLVYRTSKDAWTIASLEGRQNASKGGKLNTLLRKVFSVRISKAISNKIASWLF